MTFDPLVFEKEIGAFWKKNSVLKQIRERNASGKKFYFLQGPPYTSGRIHLGQAWNNALKDSVLRYKRMQGFNVWDRAGYDMHGLPTEQKVMAKLELAHTDNIIEFGEAKFSEECKEFSVKMASQMTTDLERIGISLDFSDPYLPVDNSYMQGVWQLIKKANEKGRLYRGLRTMGWSAHFQTALAKHEMTYKTVVDKSVFVKFKVSGTQNEYFVIWTTTPWTLPFNLAIMVNPESLYVKAKVEDEVWIVAKDLAGVFISSVAEKEFEIIEEFTGDTLQGIKYEHFWSKSIPALKELDGKYDSLHTVLLSSKYVDTNGGSGLVHCAPGCGPEDYEVGHAHGLPAFNVVDESGIFPESAGIFSQKRAKKDDVFFISQLKDDGVLIGVTPIEHEYPHDERSGEPIIFRTTEQWFFKTEDIKQDMLDYNKSINWMPQKAKNAFNSWLENLRDNSITKQRFWGTPAPIWVNENNKDDYIIVGSIKELEELGATVPANLHKPFIDEVTFTHNGNVYRRIPDVLDVWIDAGSASWNCLYNDPKLIEKWFPADFICEGKDQIRGWFNLLMVASILNYDKPSFENVYLHGFISGVDGEKMSKSLGNIISPNEIVDKYGADTLRYYMTKTRAGEDVNFSWDEVKLHYRNISMLYNVVNYFIDLVKVTDIDFTQKTKKDIEEEYILSRKNEMIHAITHQYDTYQLHTVANEFESFLVDLSRTYIQLIRDKEDKNLVAQTLFDCIKSLLIVAHPSIPYVTEHLYQQMKQVVPLDCESIQFESWPKQTSEVNQALHDTMSLAQNIIQSILACREKASLGVRWPLSKVIVTSQKDSVSDSLNIVSDLIKSQTNVKEITFATEFTDVTYVVKPNFRNLGKSFGQQTADVAKSIAKADGNELAKTVLENTVFQIQGHDITKDHVQISQQVGDGIQQSDFSFGSVYVFTQLTPELELEGMSREFIRRVQTLRKDAGLQKDASVTLQVVVSDFLKQSISQFEEGIKAKCGIEKIVFEPVSSEHTSSGKIKEEQFEIGF